MTSESPTKELLGFFRALADMNRDWAGQRYPTTFRAGPPVQGSGRERDAHSIQR